MHATLFRWGSAPPCLNAVILIICLVFLQLMSNAQGTSNPDAKLIFERNSTYPPGYPISDSTALTEFGIIVVNISDSIAVEDFAILIEDSSDGSEIFDGIINANGTVSLGPSQQINHVAGAYVIRIGKFSLAQIYGNSLSVNIIVETMDGTTIPPLNFAYPNI